MHGATVCDSHGGQAPQVKAKAEERWAELEGSALDLALVHARHELAKVERANGHLSDGDMAKLSLSFRELVDAAEKARKIGELLAGRATERTSYEIREVQEHFAIWLSNTVRVTMRYVEPAERFAEWRAEWMATLDAPETPPALEGAEQ